MRKKEEEEEESSVLPTFLSTKKSVCSGGVAAYSRPRFCGTSE